MIARLPAFLLASLLVPISQGWIDTTIEEMGPEPDVSSVWTGPVVRAFSFGFRDVLADLYWLRGVQYYGRQRLLNAPTGYADLAPLLETAAELDPRFEIVYRYGAIFLSEQPPIGAGQAETGIEFLRKGAERNPLNWRLRQDEGLLRFVYLDDAQGGAEVLLRAADIPGSAPWLRPLAAQILAQGGSLEASLQMWTIIREQSEPGFLRENATDQIEVVRNKIVAKRVQDEVAQYQSRSGDKTSTLGQLRARGVVSTATDLDGVPFDFDPSTGSVTVSRKSRYWRRSIRR